MKRIFISRHIDSESQFNLLKNAGHEITAQSLIEFEAISFDFNPEKYDWLYFYSKNGIKFFFESVTTLDPSIKIAVMGPSSASYLAEVTNLEADFIYSQAEYPLCELNDIMVDKRICFVQSIHSLKSVEKEIKTTENISCIEVYSNTPSNKQLENAGDILVFTSPLNVQYYHEQFPITDAQQVFAIGTTTAAKIKELTDLEAAYPAQPTEIELYKLVSEYLSLH